MKAERSLTGLLMGLALTGAASLPISPRIIWNRTESLPAGLYLISPGAQLTSRNPVAYVPAPHEAHLLEARGYTGIGWPLLKRVAAQEGDTVCRLAGKIRINGVLTAKALAADTAGRPLPAWSGCVLLGAKDVFLLADHPRSIDGRYFGIQSRTRVIGPAILVLPATRPSPRPRGGACGQPCTGSSDDR